MASEAHPLRGGSRMTVVLFGLNLSRSWGSKSSVRPSMNSPFCALNLTLFSFADLIASLSDSTPTNCLVRLDSSIAKKPTPQ